MQDISPHSPEQRAKQGIRVRLATLGPGGGAYEVAKRVFFGVYNDGFIHAGNLAYLTLVTLFPFFIVTAGVASLFGRDADTMQAVDGFLRTLPPAVGALLAKPIEDVLLSRTGSLLWFGVAVGLWTVGSFIETVRDILRRAYGTGYARSFWHYRLSSIAIIIVSVVLIMTAFSVQVILAAAEQFVVRFFPLAHRLAGIVNLSRIVPLLATWGAFYLLIWSLTPDDYHSAPKWPGALFVALWWYGTLALLPFAVEQLGGYDLTYGSLAGVIIALIFFWIIGLGIVISAHLNAALAEPPPMRVEGGKESVTEPA
jgi:membrane protein